MTTQVSRYQKGKTNLDFTEARDSEWQWHQLGHMQVCTALQTHASTPLLKVFTGRMPFLPPKQQRQSTEAYDFLFDFNRNCASTLYCFQDIASYLSKVADLTHPTCICCPRWG